MYVGHHRYVANLAALSQMHVLTKSVAKWFPTALSRSLCPVRCSYVYITDITVYHIIKGSLGGETSVLRTFRMSGKELVKETVSQGKS